MIRIALFMWLLLLASGEETGGAECIVDCQCGGMDAGLCIEGQCVCPSSLTDPNCSYRRVSKSTVLGLESLYLMGVGGGGRFVLGQYVNATFGLISGFSLYIVIAMCGIKYKEQNRTNRAKYRMVIITFSLLWSLGLTGTILTMIYIVYGELRDKNGYALY